MRTFRQFLKSMGEAIDWRAARDTGPDDDDVTCPACGGDDENCELCQGSGEVDIETAKQYHRDNREYDDHDDDYGEVGPHPKW